MPVDPRQRAGVVLVARIICASTQSARVSIPSLIAGCSAIPTLANINASQVGRALAGTGWEAAQWRENGGRIRGYRRAPVTGEGLRNPVSTVVRV